MLIFKKFGNILINIFYSHKVLLVFSVAVIFRLSISGLGFNNDIYSLTSWGEWIYKNGPKGFYEWGNWIYSWPTQLPLVNLLYSFNLYLYDQLQTLFPNIGVFIATFRLMPTKMLWFFDFTKWFGQAYYLETPFRYGALISMKIVAILADIIIAGVIYLIAKKESNKIALLFSIIYLFSPFSWYISSLWGQYDQISFLFLFLALLAIVKKQLLLVPILVVISVSLKPTGLIFIPFYLWLYFKQKPKLWEFLLGAIIGLAIFIYSLILFTDKNLVVFVQTELIPKIFFKSEFMVSTNSFNFWHILIGDQGLNQDTLFLGIPAKIWGIVSFIILNILAIRITKKITLETAFQSSALIGIGSWLFLTNMLDRYLFSGLVFMLLFAVYQRWLLKYWLILSLIFWLNLYNHWWFPDGFIWLKQTLMWQSSLVTRLLALINVIIFFLIIYLLKKKGNKS